MSDIASQISSILSDPEMMKQIQGLSGLFGQSAEQPTGSGSALPPAAEPQPSPLDMLGADGMQTVMKIMPLLSKLKQEDDTTRLLRAIKPFLSEARQVKLEEAIRLIRIINILPLIKQQGLFNGLF